MRTKTAMGALVEVAFTRTFQITALALSLCMENLNVVEAECTEPRLYRAAGCMLHILIFGPSCEASKNRYLNLRSP